MYIYLYIYIYKYIYVYIYIYYIYIYVHIYIYAHKYVCLCIYLYLYLHVYTYESHICCKWPCISYLLQLTSHGRYRLLCSALSSFQQHAHIYLHIHTCLYTRTYIYTNTYTYIYSYLYVYITYLLQLTSHSRRRLLFSTQLFSTAARLFSLLCAAILAVHQLAAQFALRRVRVCIDSVCVRERDGRKERERGRERSLFSHHCVVQGGEDS